MDIKASEQKEKSTVLFCCNYQAPYGGNFVPSLMALEERLLDCGMQAVYVFPDGARERNWFAQLQEMGKTMETVSFAQKRSVFRQIRELIKKHHAGIVHTHFMSAVSACLLSLKNPKVKVIGHIHSDFSNGRRDLKLRLQELLSFRVLAAKVRFLSVSPYFLSSSC